MDSAPNLKDKIGLGQLAGWFGAMSGGKRGEQSEAVGPVLAILAAIAIISLIVGTLAYSQGVESERRDRTPAAYAEAAKERALRTCRETEPATVFECIYEIVKSGQEQAQAEQDLDAQQGMNLWAAIVAALTFGTLVLTGVTVLLIKRTLDATADMLGETKELTQESIKATKAMIDANRIAINAQRPWIDIEPIFKVARISSNTVEMHVGAEFKNVGSSLADSFRYAFSFEHGRRSDFAQIEKAMLAELIDAASESSLVPGKSITSERLFGGMTKKAFAWDSDGSCGAALIAIAVYHIDGDPQARWSSVIWTLRTKSDGDWSMGDFTWEDVVRGNLEIEPRRRFSAT